MRLGARLMMAILCRVANLTLRRYHHAMYHLLYQPAILVHLPQHPLLGRQTMRSTPERHPLLDRRAMSSTAESLLAA